MAGCAGCGGGAAVNQGYQFGTTAPVNNMVLSSQQAPIAYGGLPVINMAYVGQDGAARIYEVETMTYVLGNSDGARVALVLENHVNQLMGMSPGNMMVVPGEMLPHVHQLNVALDQVQSIPYLTDEIKGKLIAAGMATYGMVIAARNSDIAHIGGISDTQAGAMQQVMKGRIGWPGVDQGIVDKAYADSGVTDPTKDTSTPEQPVTTTGTNGKSILEQIVHIGASTASKLNDAGVQTVENFIAQTDESLVALVGMPTYTIEKARESLASAKALIAQ